MSPAERDRDVVSDDAALFARMRDGDVAAFETVFRAHYEGLRRFAFSYVYSLDVAEDLVQDAMLAVWERRADVATHTAPVAYLYQTVRNRALDLIAHNTVVERHVTDPTAGSAASAPGADELVFASELERVVHAHVEALPPRLREVYRLRRDEGLSNAEIARALGITVQAVYVRMTRAMQTLQVTLAPWIE